MPLPERSGSSGLIGSCGFESLQDGGCALLNVLAGCLDPGDCLVAVTGPGCDVPEGVVTGVDPKYLADDVCRGLSLQLGERSVVVALVEQGVGQLVSKRLHPLRGGVGRLDPYPVIGGAAITIRVVVLFLVLVPRCRGALRCR